MKKTTNIPIYLRISIIFHTFAAKSVSNEEK